MLVDEARTTFENGFVGFWLPRDIAGTLRVTYDGKVGEAAFAAGTHRPASLPSNWRERSTPSTQRAQTSAAQPMGPPLCVKRRNLPAVTGGSSVSAHARPIHAERQGCRYGCVRQRL